MYNVHGTKQRIKQGKILEDHGLYAPDIMVAQSGQSVGGYTLENLELEYETVENQELVSDVISGYEVGQSLIRTHNFDENNRVG